MNNFMDNLKMNGFKIDLEPKWFFLNGGGMKRQKTKSQKLDYL